MADTFLRVKPPTISFNSVSIDDPRSFEIVRQAMASYYGGRPSQGHATTDEVFTCSWNWSATFGDEIYAYTAALYSNAVWSDKTLVGVSVASHTGTNKTYTLSNSTVKMGPRAGAGYQEARTFTFSGTARSTDGSTLPLAVA